MAEMGREPRLAILAMRSDVCFWHKADIATVPNDVPFWGKADINERQSHARFCDPTKTHRAQILLPPRF
jgi:hypothetical protein